MSKQSPSCSKTCRNVVMKMVERRVVRRHGYQEIQDQTILTGLCFGMVTWFKYLDCCDSVQVKSHYDI